ncbi:MAG TPA: hypothetical protein VEY12_06135 [Thermoplasmata archaeon]|nr:hypothetical protein [Thermoplasmata archaeon]
MDLRRLAMPLLALAFLSLVLGIWAGLVRVGWPWPSLTPEFWLAHGPLMVSGFVGTLIAVERAVALGRRWGVAAPVLTAAGALVLVAVPHWVGPLLIVLGSAVLAVLFADVLHRHATPSTAVMLLGAAAWVVGNALWLVSYPNLDVDAVILWWMAFLVLVISGERLELSRVLRLPWGAHGAFLLLADAVVVGAAWSALDLGAGSILAGLALLGVAAWLLRFDIARIQIRQRALRRFIAAALLPGYVWLGLGGLFVALSGLAPFPLIYDAEVHAVFLGFVISMIFAHAPIIFPAVLGLPLPYRAWFYGHLVLLHVGLGLRIAGDLATAEPIRRWGALLNGAALVGFLFATGAAVGIGRREARSVPG